jgi:hypothetical protein
MPDLRAVLADIAAELRERGIEPRPLAVLARAPDRGVDESVLETLAELLAEAEAAA